MQYLNLTCPPVPYFIVGGMRIFRPGDAHERRTTKNVFDLIYVKSGQLHIQQGDMEASLNGGQFFIILPGIPHKGGRVCLEKTELLWLHFYTNMPYFLSDEIIYNRVHCRLSPKYYYAPLSFTISLPQTGTIAKEKRPEVERYLDLLDSVSYDNYVQKKSFPVMDYAPYDAQVTFSQFLHTVSSQYCLGQQSDGIAEKVHAYFDLYYMKDLSLVQLARQFHYSPSQMIRCFNSVYGVSPKQYLTQLRIQKAEHLLSNSTVRVADIGTAVGFHSPSYFIQRFKKSEGMTPAQYRARAQVGARSGE